jgi:hypothetical protein
MRRALAALMAVGAAAGLAAAAAWFWWGHGITGLTTVLIWGFAVAWMGPLGAVTAVELRRWWQGRGRGYWRA